MGAIIGVITEIISVLKALWGLWSEYQSYKAEQKIIADAKRKADLEKALEDAKKAESDADIFKSQHGVVDNSN